jgi:glycosyltransferase involved in cell wall biosynthesis
MNEKPLWSIMIPTYNCATYVSKTITSVLEQDLGEQLMQIEVIDDCSNDHIEEVVQQVGKGRVKFYKQPKNVGHVKNFETALTRAKGEIIHLLHGDDYVLPGFYEAMSSMYDLYPEIGTCFCRHFFVDEENNIIRISNLLKKENSILTDFYKTLIYGQKIQTPSITVKKEVYNKIGHFNPNLLWTEDWEMWVRITSKYPIGYIKEPLAAYRVHKSSSTGRKTITGENVEDLLRIKNIFKSYIQTKDELDELEHSFKKMIYQISKNNFIASRAIGHNEAYKHLKTMAKNSSSFVNRFRLYMNYYKKRYGY